jgi:hypothetical protein
MKKTRYLLNAFSSNKLIKGRSREDITSGPLDKAGPPQTFFGNQNSRQNISSIRGCMQKFPDWVDNEIYAYNNKHSLRSNTNGYGGKTH